VALLALPVRQPADGEQIGALEQADPVLQRQALSGRELGGDLAETRGGHSRVHDEPARLRVVVSPQS